MHVLLRWHWSVTSVAWTRWTAVLHEVASTRRRRTVVRLPWWSVLRLHRRRHVDSRI